MFGFDVTKVSIPDDVTCPTSGDSGRQPPSEDNSALLDLAAFRRKRPKSGKTPEHLKETLPFDLTQSKLSDTEKSRVLDMLYSHYDCFVDSRGTIGHCTRWQHEIQIKHDAKLCALVQFKLSPMIQEKLQRQVDRMLEQGVLEIADTFHMELTCHVSPLSC